MRLHYRRQGPWLSLAAVTILLSACSSAPQKPASIGDTATRTVKAPVSNSNIPALPPAGSGRGGYYMDDGPGEHIPEGLLNTPDPEPKVEPYAARGNKPYVALGKSYVPILDDKPFKQRGIGSWYGRKFHGQKTSSGELYDMYKMTAAHPTLPIPSYARVTNVKNGKQVIVRINDRGPFHSNRIIDLSYTAALKLGYVGRGSSELEVERLLPEDIARMAAGKSAANELNTQATQTPLPTKAAPAEPAVAPAAVVVSAPATSTSSGGYYLQVGAFSQADKAETSRALLQLNWGGVLMPIEVSANNGVYRLFSGPFATRAEAAEAAQKLQEGGAAKPLIVQK